MEALKKTGRGHRNSHHCLWGSSHLISHCKDCQCLRVEAAILVETGLCFLMAKLPLDDG